MTQGQDGGQRQRFLLRVSLSLCLSLVRRPATRSSPHRGRGRAASPPSAWFSPKPPSRRARRRRERETETIIATAGHKDWSCRDPADAVEDASLSIRFYVSGSSGPKRTASPCIAAGSEPRMRSLCDRLGRPGTGAALADPWARGRGPGPRLRLGDLEIDLPPAFSRPCALRLRWPMLFSTTSPAETGSRQRASRRGSMCEGISEEKSRAASEPL